MKQFSDPKSRAQIAIYLKYKIRDSGITPVVADLDKHRKKRQAELIHQLFLENRERKRGESSTHE